MLDLIRVFSQLPRLKIYSKGIESRNALGINLEKPKMSRKLSAEIKGGLGSLDQTGRRPDLAGSPPPVWISFSLLKI
jgi:hypothetical protein